MEKKFISILWGYHKQIFSFQKEQNYHMHPIQVMKDDGYICEIFAIDADVKIENDPNFVEGTKVTYYKNIFQYLHFLWSNRNHILYSNSLTIRTLLVGCIGKHTFFYPHANISGSTGKSIVKKGIIKFFYKRFSCIRVNNSDESSQVEKMKKGLSSVCPLVISSSFLDTGTQKRNGGVFIGNLTHVKNPLLLLEACRILKQKAIFFPVTIIGEDRSNMLQKIHEYGLEDTVVLTGFIPHTELQTYLSTSMIYINTSLGEGQCLAVYEGALGGCALSLQNILSFPSVFGDNALYQNTARELAENITFLLENESKRNKMIQYNQDMILEKYNYTTISSLLKEMFTEYK